MWLEGGEEDLGISRLDLCMHTAEDRRQKWKQSDLVKRGSAAKAQQAPVPPLTIVYRVIFVPRGDILSTQKYFTYMGTQF